MYLPVIRSLATGSRVTVRYKRTTDSSWRDAHPLLRIHPEWTTGGAPVTPVDSFAGTIFDLSPGTTYNVELTLVEPGRANQVLTTSATTRALPPAAPAATKTATPADIVAKMASLVAGDVLQLANGTYSLGTLAFDRSGTVSQPIYVRGASRTGVIIKNGSGAVLQLLEASNIVFENMTIEGSNTDSGQLATSQGISFWNGTTQQNVTLRDLDIRGVDMGIIASGPVFGVLIYNCTLTGNNLWNSTFLASNGQNMWNDDGVRVPGEGNCAWNNTLYGFGDSFAVNDGDFSAAIYFWRNRIRMTGDDSFEGDYGTRNIGFYDNYITNCGTLLSCDPVWGGPLYCFRNICINTFRGPYKLNSQNTGHLIYNNTVVRTDGTTGWGWVQFNNGPQRNWSFRNNITVYRGSGSLMAIESAPVDPVDFTNNAWFPDKAVWWTNAGGSFSSLAQARSSLPVTTPVFGTSTARHQGDVITVSNPFTTTVTLGADHVTENTTTAALALTAGTSPKNAGTAIPNITDGFTGAAPDMGAIIEGRGVPTWGAAR